MSQFEKSGHSFIMIFIVINILAIIIFYNQAHEISIDSSSFGQESSSVGQAIKIKPALAAAQKEASRISKIKENETGIISESDLPIIN